METTMKTELTKLHECIEATQLLFKAALLKREAGAEVLWDLQVWSDRLAQATLSDDERTAAQEASTAIELTAKLLGELS